MELIALYIITIIAAIYYWPYYRETSHKIFLPFLLFVLFNEVAAYYLGYHTKLPNQYLYNIYIVITFFVYAYWFWQNLKEKIVILFFVVLFLGFLIYDIKNERFAYDLYYRSFIILSISSITLALLVFNRILRSEKALTYYKLTSFWIVSGFLIFYVAMLPFILFQKEIETTSFSYGIVLFVLNLILYGSFIIGFYVARSK